MSKIFAKFGQKNEENYAKKKMPKIEKKTFFSKKSKSIRTLVNIMSLVKNEL